MTTTEMTQNLPSTGCRLVAADGRELLLAETRLDARAGGGLCRARLQQTFHNPFAEALTLTYLLPLPADGAVRGFAFRVGDRRIVGEIDRRQVARERFEQALVEGRTAALLEQDRSSLFTQELGNVPPGATVVAEIEVDQPLLWVQKGLTDVGAWEWRFPTTVAPRYMGAAERVTDAGKTMVDVAEGAPPPRLRLTLDVGDAITGEVTSPSHAIFAKTDENGHDTQIGLTAEAGAQLDRDVVIRWPVAAAEIGSRIEVAPAADGIDGLHGLLTLVPPAGEVGSVVSRDVTVLLDTSGSMSGEPLEQARAVVGALVDSLGERDRLEMIEFSNRPRRWKRLPKVMKPSNRAKAQNWLSGLQAGGGTEMHSAVLEAVQAPGTGSQRQILLVTDGLIGFETEIVTTILEHMPASSRFHVVAVGSAPNRSLTQAAARAGRGIERGVQLGEDPKPLAEQLVAHTAQPLVVDLQLSGSAFLESAPERLPDLFAGCPARLAVRLRPEGGDLVLQGRRADGPFEQRLSVAPAQAREGRQELVTWFGREKIEDLEMRVAKGENQDAAIEALALRYKIASRMTSWVAIHNERTVNPTAPTRQQNVPHELPHGMSMEGLGLRSCAAPAQSIGFRAQDAAKSQDWDGLAECEVAEESAGAVERPVSPLPAPAKEELRRHEAPEPEGAPPRGGKASKRKTPSPRDNVRQRADLGDDSFGGGLPPIRARFVRLPDGSLVVEFDGNDLLALGLSHWLLPPVVQLSFDGAVIPAQTDATTSTATGSPLQDLRLRVRLNWPVDAPNDLPVSVSFLVGNQQVTLLTQPA